jgi:SAM-dependent methyltransferase
MNMDDFFSESFFERWLTEAVPKIPELKEYLEMENNYLGTKIRPRSLILDVGCGFGRHMELLLPFSEGVIGVDSSLYMLNQASNKIKANNMFLCTQHAKELNIIDDAFDYVICMTNTFGNFGDYKLDALNEMKRVCKNKGTIVVSVYSEGSVNPRVRSYEEVGLNDLKIDGNTITTREGLVSECFTRGSLEEIFAASGLKASIYRLNSASYLCEAVK